MPGYVLDTHVLVWWLEGNAKLPNHVRDLLADTNADLYIPALVIVEIIDLIQKQRISLLREELIEALSSEARVVVLPLNQTIALGTNELAVLDDIHDRCIVSTTQNLTASGLDVSLITADRAIHNSRLVKVIWDG